MSYRTIWKGNGCRVRVDKLKGLRYEYTAYRTPGIRCSFTFFCEVGVPYQPLFNGFFDLFETGGTVEYPERPWFADKLLGPKTKDDV